MDGSKQFEFWGSSRKGAWEEGCAGGDRMHTSFVDNPQFILRAKPGTNLCLVLHDVDEEEEPVGPIEGLEDLAVPAVHARGLEVLRLVLPLEAHLEQLGVHRRLLQPHEEAGDR